MRPSLNFYFLLFAVAALQFILMLDITSSLSMINNGDYYRVTRGLINLPPFGDIDTCPEFTYKFKIPASSLGIVVGVSAWFFETLGLPCFSLKTYTLVLYSTFLFGCFLAVFTDKKNLLTILVLSAIAILYSAFFLSFYEEAIVIVAMPWLIAGLSFIQEKRTSIYFLFAACCILFAKVQMVILLPFFLYILMINFRKKRICTYVLVAGFLFLSFSSAATFFAKSGNSIPNSYNRLYNGIGWSVLNVSAWGKGTFNERHHHYYANRTALLSNAQSNLLPTKLSTYLGTSYWPTGNEIFSNEVNLVETKEQISKTLKPNFYLKTLFTNNVFFDLIRSVYEITLKSNYSISYLLQNDEKKRKSNQLKNHLQKYLGLSFFAIALYGLLRESLAGKVAGLTIVLMPLLVVGGDGFYEFEKHMVPFFMVLPIVFMPFYISHKVKRENSS